MRDVDRRLLELSRGQASLARTIAIGDICSAPHHRLKAADVALPAPVIA
jgi:hypothetical protein